MPSGKEASRTVSLGDNRIFILDLWVFLQVGAEACDASASLFGADIDSPGGEEALWVDTTNITDKSVRFVLEDGAVVNLLVRGGEFGVWIEVR